MDVLEKSINSDTKLRHFSEKKKYLFKHEKGGYLLSLIATLIGFVLTSNSQKVFSMNNFKNSKAFKRTLEMLSQRDVVIEDVKKCLRDYLKFMEGTEGNKPVTREILENILKLIK
ncbi:hypothetical protein MHBO_000339 [Bonamia ostreae]|uniref:LAGLIDADG homing endonuclease n=1 Tax=Bonamia ostreae TaxID=126728 RepID=A0ABV2AF99_9EUKA